MDFDFKQIEIYVQAALCARQAHIDEPCIVSNLQRFVWCMYGHSPRFNGLVVATSSPSIYVSLALSVACLINVWL
jgi:hypothetical protein